MRSAITKGFTPQAWENSPSAERGDGRTRETFVLNHDGYMR